MIQHDKEMADRVSGFAYESGLSSKEMEQLLARCEERYKKRPMNVNQKKEAFGVQKLWRKKWARHSQVEAVCNEQ